MTAVFMHIKLNVFCPLRKFTFILKSVTIFSINYHVFKFKEEYKMMKQKFR